MSKEQSPIEEIRLTLNRMIPQFKLALPAQIPVERFARVAQTAIASNTDLLACDRTSLYAAVMRCAQDGLLPDGREAAIVKYGNIARYLPMVAGICKKARNSGEIKAMDAKVVYEMDHYQSWTDEHGDHFEYRKAHGHRGEPTMTFAYATTHDGGLYIEEIDETQMEAIEKCSRASDGPWKGPFKDEMRRKSAIRRLAKYRLPTSTDLDEVLRADDDMYDMSQANQPVNVPPKQEPEAVPKRPKKLAQAVEKQKAEPSGPSQPSVQPEAKPTTNDVI